MDKLTDDYTSWTSESGDTSYWNASTTSSNDLSNSLRFWILLVFDIFAILCSIFTLYHLLTKNNLRKAVRNHSPILMLLFCLIYDLIDIPLHLQFFSTGIVRPTTPQLCLIWWFFDWSFYYTIELLLLFTSIERHILIFHSQMLATSRNRLLIHYLPMLFIVIFMMTFYSIAIFAPPCVNTFDYTYDSCGLYACYVTVPFFLIFEQLGFSMTSSCLIAVFNIALLIRVLLQKHRLRQSIQWRKQRKLAIQVILMSLLFLTFSLPLSIIYLVRMFGQPDWGTKVFPPLFFISYFPVFFLPFVCLSTIPSLWTKIKKLDLRHRQIAVAPT